MMGLLTRLAATGNRISEQAGRAVAVLTGLMVLVTFTVVVLRYGFNLGWISMQESIVYLYATNFMLGMAYTLQRDGHVRVDIIYQKFGPRGRAWVNLLGTMFLLLPMCGFILWTSWDYVAESWAVLETSSEAGGLPWVYLLKSLLLVMPALLLVQGLAMLAESLLTLLGQATKGPHDGVKEI
ncbi:MAG: TRAP transporter small permease subunit [Proteobacteria bacterium]|jgi:TRAP-type mannitol/chloroaromatic compound transport system permease small subunit|nr:TRAP transporter small permease subunit [Pseudomonadota bacterium]